MPLIDILVALVLVVLIAWLTNAYVPVSPQVKRILNVVLGLIVVGILLWLVNTYVPMAGAIKAMLNIVVVIACCVWVLKAFGLWDRTVRFWHDLTNRHIPNERV
jgi:predicted membrane protein